MCRSKESSDNVILLLLDDKSVLDTDLSLYIRALAFQENDYNDSLVYALQHIDCFKLPECILLFSVIYDRNLIMQHILSILDHNVEKSLEILFIVGVYNNSLETIRTIFNYAPWIRKTESFARAIAICDNRSFPDLKNMLLYH